jgi:hypothetical protein
MSSEEDEEVFSKGDTVFFFCDVSTKSVRELCRHMQKLSNKYEEIRVNMRSDGGCVSGSVGQNRTNSDFYAAACTPVSRGWTSSGPLFNLARK